MVRKKRKRLKSKSKKKKNRRKKKKKNFAAQKLINRIGSVDGDLEEIPVIYTEKNKLSEKILRLVEILPEPPGMTAQQGEALIGIAVMAWNIAVSPRSIAKESYKDMLKALPSKSREDKIISKQVLDTLIKRKKELFPDDRRFITDYEFSVKGNKRHLYVIALIP